MDFADVRMEICMECPLYTKLHGGMCNNNLYLNPETNDISYYSKNGYVRGCGCILSHKVVNKNSSCPLKKW